jgi:hypothetical protein
MKCSALGGARVCALDHILDNGYSNLGAGCASTGSTTHGVPDAQVPLSWIDGMRETEYENQ